MSTLYISSCIGQSVEDQIMPDHGAKSLILLVYFFGRIILDLCILPLLLCLPPTCDLPSLLLAGFVRLVKAILTPAWVALACLRLRILAPLTGLSLALQVLDLATILPFLGPDTHLNPDFNLLPTLRRIWPMPSAMADMHSSATTSCGTASCAILGAMTLVVLGWIISLIFIAIFMELTVPDTSTT